MYTRKKSYNSQSVLEKVVGRGIQFSPMRYNEKTLSNTGVDRITQSLFVILSTPIGSRFFNPDFGTHLYELLFEQNDFILADSIKYYVTEDIKAWEPRIDFTVNVKFVEGSDKINVEITYTIKGDSNEYNFVYPVNRNLHPLGGELVV